jgi:hypothetical protein
MAPICSLAWMVLCLRARRDVVLYAVAEHAPRTLLANTAASIIALLARKLLCVSIVLAAAASLCGTSSCSRAVYALHSKHSMAAGCISVFDLLIKTACMLRCLLPSGVYLLSGTQVGTLRHEKTACAA